MLLQLGLTLDFFSALALGGTCLRLGDQCLLSQAAGLLGLLLRLGCLCRRNGLGLCPYPFRGGRRDFRLLALDAGSLHLGATLLGLCARSREHIRLVGSDLLCGSCCGRVGGLLAPLLGGALGSCNSASLVRGLAGGLGRLLCGLDLRLGFGELLGCRLRLAEAFRDLLGRGLGGGLLGGLDAA